jgi:hypothetical protein
MTSPHILCIMSHYTDAALSLRRLEISRATLLPSLQAHCVEGQEMTPPEKK